MSEQIEDRLPPSVTITSASTVEAAPTGGMPLCTWYRAAFIWRGPARIYKVKRAEEEQLWVVTGNDQAPPGAELLYEIRQESARWAG